MARLVPTSAEEARDMVAAAAADGIALEIVSGGTKRQLGRPVEAETRLDLSRLSGVISYEPEELLLEVLPATPLSEIETLLAQRRQTLAFEPPHWTSFYDTPGRATIAGAIAGNLSGPRRPFAGAARDHLLGATFVTGRGELQRAGGRVVKNVTGFDVPKLLAGSFGTLGVFTALTLRVLPAAADEATLVLRDLPEARALAVLARAAGLPAQPSGLVHLPRAILQRGWTHRFGEAALTALRFEGARESLSERIARVRRALHLPEGDLLSASPSRAFWRDIRELAPFARLPGALWRLSVPPGDGLAVAAEIGASATLFDWAGGQLFCLVEAEASADATLVRQTLRRRSGHATLLRASEALRQRIDVFEPMTPALDGLTRRLKAAFDPNGILNPGRMYAGV